MILGRPKLTPVLKENPERSSLCVLHCMYVYTGPENTWLTEGNCTYVGE
jgi:hypothetical protein